MKKGQIVKFAEPADDTKQRNATSSWKVAAVFWSAAGLIDTCISILYQMADLVPLELDT